jgi:hypothetical protein
MMQNGVNYAKFKLIPPQPLSFWVKVLTKSIRRGISEGYILNNQGI